MLFKMLWVEFELDFSQPLFFNDRKSERKERGGGGGKGERSEPKFPIPVKCDVQFSRDSIRAFNDQIKIRETRGLWTVRV